jgi:hypothetical protein
MKIGYFRGCESHSVHVVRYAILPSVLNRYLPDLESSCRHEVRHLSYQFIWSVGKVEHGLGDPVAKYTILIPRTGGIRPRRQD